jgi:hypothetical protein
VAEKLELAREAELNGNSTLVRRLLQEATDLEHQLGVDGKSGD